MSRQPGSSGAIWIQGAGELASGVAVRLYRCGYRLIMAETPHPRAVRRLVSFAEAVYTGRQAVEDVPAELAEVGRVTFEARSVMVIVDPQASQLDRLRPDAVVDARMDKRPPVEPWSGRWPVVGLGPGWRCGRDCDLIVETQRGPRLGAVIAANEAAPNSGVPGAIGGETWRRVLRAPAAGQLRPRRRLGDLVQAGEVLGEVGGSPLVATLGGRLRGLVHESVELSVGDKVGDIDPRGADVDPSLVSDKALAVAGGVLEALLRLRVMPACPT